MIVRIMLLLDLELDEEVYSWHLISYLLLVHIFFHWCCFSWIIWKIFRLTCQYMMWTQGIKLYYTGLLPISHIFRQVFLVGIKIFYRPPSSNLKLRDVKFHFKVALWKLITHLFYQNAEFQMHRGNVTHGCNLLH